MVDLKIWNTCDYKVMSGDAAHDSVSKHPFFHVTFPDGTMFCCTPDMLVKLGEAAAKCRAEYGLGVRWCTDK